MISALEGFRDVKSSLASGALVLIGIGLLLAGHLSREGGVGSLWMDVRQGVEFFGIPAVLAGLTFLAYLLGVSVAFDRILFAVVDRNHWTHPKVNSESQARLRAKLSSDLDETSKEFDKTAEDMALILGMADPITDSEKQELLESFGIDAPVGSWANVEHEVHRARLLKHLLEQMEQSVDILSVRLGGSSAVASDRYEKAAAEASFRGAVTIPVFLVSLSVVARLCMEGLHAAAIATFLAGLLAATLMGLRACEKRSEASEELMNAIAGGLIECPGIAELRMHLSDKKSLGLGLGI